MTDLTGKTAVITGASRGIGAATARIFAEAGANVALLARSDDEIAELAGEIGAQAVAIPCDVSRFWEVSEAFEKVRAAFGSLDILINNAGVLKPIAPLAEADPEDWGKVIDINVKGVFNGMRAVIPAMAAAGGGTIITVSSGAAHNPLEGWSAYCTSKAGAAMLTRAAHLENVDKGLRIMGMSPGTVATQMQRDIKASGVNAVSELDWEDHIPPEWPAKLMLWMCGAGADAHLGEELSMRSEELRRIIGVQA
ncbi:SDR family oxidoreductase [Pseudooceanicola algae]|uniref:3-phenylpropionate-dihydrodiol/cinnamic acid-dihydrodiol dehydrogenase n=1 Tax=Pseudooceanicola algae TaxID=1537215 RepID=A0A418SFZ8_9RHOB|nr:SDR family oxidoreductase [Pseudooceanicola algae]QPM91594.1 3-phenylpropionate-dihydrodiol/cinnamic acid-dihydrodiol dehydrogenase [Pseudooceanicola algae]